MHSLGAVHGERKPSFQWVASPLAPDRPLRVLVVLALGDPVSGVRRTDSEGAQQVYLSTMCQALGCRAGGRGPGRSRRGAARPVLAGQCV